MECPASDWIAGGSLCCLVLEWGPVWWWCYGGAQSHWPLLGFTHLPFSMSVRRVSIHSCILHLLIMSTIGIYWRCTRTDDMNRSSELHHGIAEAFWHSASKSSVRHLCFLNMFDSGSAFSLRCNTNPLFSSESHIEKLRIHFLCCFPHLVFPAVSCELLLGMRVGQSNIYSLWQQQNEANKYEASSIQLNLHCEYEIAVCHGPLPLHTIIYLITQCTDI